jgi:hypothetical protein
MNTELIRIASVIAVELHIQNDIAELAATGEMQDMKVYYHDLHCVFSLAKKFEDYFERGNEAMKTPGKTILMIPPPESLAPFLRNDA